MLPCGCKPDGMTYGILISAYDKGNQWCLALQVCSKSISSTHLQRAHYSIFVEAACGHADLLLSNSVQVGDQI